MREELTLISAKASNLQSPNFYDDTVLWTAFILCGQIGPIENRPLLQSMTAPAFGAATSRLTAQWVGELTGQWVNGLRDCRSDTHRVEALPGGALVNSVVQQAVQVFLIHRRCVRNNTDYQFW